MKIDGFFSLKDYFNYYISGFVWIIDIVITSALISHKNFDELTILLGKLFDSFGSIGTGILFLLTPYIVGFLLYPISQSLRRSIQGEDRKWFPSPRKWVLLRSEDFEIYKNEKKRIPLLYKKRLPRNETKVLLELARKRFSISYKTNQNLLFQPMYIYLLENGNEAAKHAVRMRDLMSLTESLLTPVPLLLGLITVSIIQNYWKYTGIIIAGVTFWLLLSRYYRLELDWTKRVYRGFLTVVSKEK